MKDLKLIGTIALLVVLVPIFIYGLVTMILGRQVAAELAKIKSRGEPVVAADLAGKPIPDAINGAIIYEQAIKLLPHRPHASVDIASLDNCDLLSEKRKNAATWKNAREALAKYGCALDLVDQALAKPQCRFKAKWQNGNFMIRPYSGGIRWLAKLAAIRAIVQARDGDMSGSAKSVSMVLHISYATKDDALFIGISQRAEIIAMAKKALLAAAEYGQFSDADAKILADEFEKIDLAPSFIKAMQGERAVVMTTFSQIKGRDGTNLMMCIAGGSGAWQIVPRVYASPIGRAWVYQDQLRSLRFMEKQIKLCGLTYRETRKINLSQMYKEWDRYMGYSTCPIYIRGRSVVDSAKVNAQGSALLLALQSYKQRVGHYPASLADLKAKVPWNLATEDPYSGNDFIYKNAAKGFLLYSIGRNLKNEGGWDDYTPAQRKMHPRPDKPDDIVWKMER